MWIYGKSHHQLGFGITEPGSLRRRTRVLEFVDLGRGGWPPSFQAPFVPKAIGNDGGERNHAGLSIPHYVAPIIGAQPALLSARVADGSVRRVGRSAVTCKAFSYSPVYRPFHLLLQPPSLWQRTGRPRSRYLCMRSEELARSLADNFAEVPMARGLSDGGVLVTVFAGKSGNTWTLAITQPSGVSCIFSTGEGFEFLPPAAALSASAAPA